MSEPHIFEVPDDAKPLFSVLFLGSHGSLLWNAPEGMAIVTGNLRVTVTDGYPPAPGEYKIERDGKVMFQSGHVAGKISKVMYNPPPDWWRE